LKGGETERKEEQRIVSKRHTKGGEKPKKRWVIEKDELTTGQNYLMVWILVE
jgi:hypothetical protein